MRHSDINLTMSRYSHVLVEQEGDAVAALPDLAAPPSQAARSTGTAGSEPDTARLALCLALPGRTQATSVDSGRQNHRDMPPSKIGENSKKTLDCGGKPGTMDAREEGLERLNKAVACTGKTPAQMSEKTRL